MMDHAAPRVRCLLTLLIVLCGWAVDASASRAIPDERGLRRKQMTQAQALPLYSAEALELLENLRQLKRNLGRFPDDPGLHGWRAWFYSAAGDYDSSIADLLYLLHYHPEDRDSRLFLGQTYLDKADAVNGKEGSTPRVWAFIDLAVGELEQVHAARPDDAGAAQALAVACNNQAYHLYRRRQELDRALGLINRAIRLQPQETFYLSTKAEVLYALGRHREALSHIHRALRDYPDVPEIVEDLRLIQAALKSQ